MKKVQLWSVRRDDKSGKLSAYDVPSVENTETEEQLEDILVRSPDVLMEGLTLIGRQVPTEGGPLDLLGVDQDGRLIIFELKRETLTRDAVAQVLDYTSGLSRMNAERFARLIEDSSGQRGIDKIEDFADWYFQTFPDRDNFHEDTPKMVLVGLGVDSRALRIVDFLADSGIDISLLTFNAFEKDGSLFLARQVESVSPKSAKTEKFKSQRKEVGLQALRENAIQYEVTDFIEEAAGFIEKQTPEKLRKWPGKWGYTFSFNEYTEEGRPTARVYVGVSINKEQQGVLNLGFRERAEHIIGDALSPLTNTLPNSRSKKYNTLVLTVPKDKWVEVKEPLERALEKMAQGWKDKISEQ